MKTLFASLLILATLTGCTTGSEEAQSTLRKAGFTDISTGGLDHWSCGKDDLIGREFTATNSQGLRVEGTVCCGNFKGCTVRF